MIEADSHVDEQLQKQAARTARPDRLQHFVAFEKLSVVEEPDAFLDAVLHVQRLW